MITYIMYQIIILLIGFGMGYLVAKSKQNQPAGKSEKLDLALEKTIELFHSNQEITNNDVERILGVSDATATRYLDKLEKAGKIVQIGTEGRGVKYKQNN